MTNYRYEPTDEDRAFCAGLSVLNKEDRQAILARASEIEPSVTRRTRRSDEAIDWILDQRDAGNPAPFEEWGERAPDYISPGEEGALSYLCDIVGYLRASRRQREVAVEIYEREK